MDSQSTEERAEKVIIALTPEQLKDICANAAEIGAKEALKTYEQERKKEQGKRADRRLRNTKLLLRNYHMLKEHAENSVFGRTQMEESALDILESMMNLYDNEVIIESIKEVPPEQQSLYHILKLCLGCMMPTAKNLRTRI